MIEKIMIRNYRIFESFDLELNSGMNLVVGDNDAGKSSLVEAINLALTGRVNGRPAAYELSPYLFNKKVTDEYVAQLQANEKPSPPEIIIDLFLSDDDPSLALLRGSNNLTGNDALGVRIRVAMSQEFAAEYQSFITEPEKVKLIPAEYYNVEWLGFSGNGITTRSAPLSTSFIDAASIRLQNGADYHLQSIIREHLDPKDRVELSRSYRSTRETFAEHESVKAVNAKLSGTRGDVTDRELTLGIDISQRYTWESSLVAHLDGLPYQYVGDGEATTLKILLALNRGALETQVILIEEPENHLSFSSLNMLISKIDEKCKGKQVIITTHSSFVLNKLGLGNLVLLSATSGIRIGDLPQGTQDYFMKLSGYDTLRLVLAKKVILVEGPSDELIVQRAYLDAHAGHLPINDGIDVINVRGLSFKRFLDIAKLLKRPAAVVTDNDDSPATDIAARYSDYTSESFITIHVGTDGNGRTLEPQLLAANDRASLNAILDKDFDTDQKLLDYMKSNKTTVGLAVFNATTSIAMPEYIQNAVQ